MLWIIILILIIIILCIIFRKQAQQEKPLTVQPLTEPFDHSISTLGSKFESTLRRPYRGVFNSRFNGRMAIDDQYFYDSLYDDVVYYGNSYDQNYMLNDVVETGMQKCLRENPNGYCVEFGVSGDAQFFPY